MSTIKYKLPYYSTGLGNSNVATDEKSEASIPFSIRVKNVSDKVRTTKIFGDYDKYIHLNEGKEFFDYTILVPVSRLTIKDVFDRINTGAWLIGHTIVYYMNPKKGNVSGKFFIDNKNNQESHEVNLIQDPYQQTKGMVRCMESFTFSKDWEVKMDIYPGNDVILNFYPASFTPNDI